MKIAVLGAGNGGLATAVHLTLGGAQINLYTRDLDRLPDSVEDGRLSYEGVLGTGEIQLPLVTDDISRAVDKCELIILSVPSTELDDYGERLAKALCGGEKILLNPGGTLGSLRLLAALSKNAPGVPVTVGEFSTLAYAARRQPGGEIRISNVVNALPAGVYPGRDTEQVAELIKPFYSGAQFGSTILHPALNNLNPIEHPAQVILNAGRIEDTEGDFLFYIEGTTPAVGRVIDQTDVERRQLCAGLGVESDAFVSLFYAAGYTTKDGADSGSSFRALQESEANSTFQSPPTLEHRYVTEDIGHSLVAWETLAEVCGVDVPVISAQITIAESMMGRDYRGECLLRRYMKDMGLATVEELQRYLSAGPTK